jgi:hypothetical protein
MIEEKVSEGDHKNAEKNSCQWRLNVATKIVGDTIQSEDLGRIVEIAKY